MDESVAATEEEAPGGEPAEEGPAESEPSDQQAAEPPEDHSAALLAALDQEKDLAQRHLVLTEKLQTVMASQKAL